MKLTVQQAFQNLDSFLQQALGAGLFKTWNDAGIAQQSLLTIKTFIDEKQKEESKSEQE